MAVGAIFFFQMVGIAISPAILGFAQTIVSDLESGLKFVFLLSAIALTTALLLTVTIHEMLLGTEVMQEGERSKSAVLNETSPS